MIRPALAAVAFAVLLPEYAAAQDAPPAKSPTVEAAPEPPKQPDPPPAEPADPPSVEDVKDAATAGDRPPLSTYDRLRQENNEPLEEERTLTGQLIRTVLALGVVVGLIYLIFKLGLGRLLQGGGIPGLTSSSGREVKVLERTAIDGKNALYLIELSGARRILVGGGDHGVSYLCEAGTTPEEAKSRAFSDVLKEQSEGESDDA